MSDIRSVTRELTLEPIAFPTGWARLRAFLAGFWLVIPAFLLFLAVLSAVSVGLWVSYAHTTRSEVVNAVLIGIMFIVLGVYYVKALRACLRDLDVGVYNDWYARMDSESGPVGMMRKAWHTTVWQLASAELMENGVLTVCADIEGDTVAFDLEPQTYWFSVSEEPMIRSDGFMYDLPPEADSPNVIKRAKNGDFDTIVVRLFVFAELRRPAGTLVEPLSHATIN